MSNHVKFYKKDKRHSLSNKKISVYDLVHLLNTKFGLSYKIIIEKLTKIECVNEDQLDLFVTRQIVKKWGQL
mgnify:FL=1